MTPHLASAVHLLLRSNGSVLMIRRHNTGYEDGRFSLVAGHVDPGEPAQRAMQREAKEEADIDIAPDDLEFVHIMHRWSEGVSRHDFFFHASVWSGEVRNAEPHKCDLMAWYDPDHLPENTVPYIRAALVHIGHGHGFGEFGWEN